MNFSTNRSRLAVTMAAMYAAVALILGYALLGLLPMFLFAFGFLGGLLCWLGIRTDPQFGSFRVAYFITLGLFVLHKLEERYLGFFPALAEITGVPAPQEVTVLGMLLYALAGAWLLIPFLVVRGYQFGYYLAWSFFTAMGVTELAHFILPFFTAGQYGYFPGMASTTLLAPAAWWGMWRMSRTRPHGTG